MARKKTALLDRMLFEQLIERAWRESEEKNLRRAARKSPPPKKTMGSEKILKKQPAPKSHVRPTAA